MIALKTQMTFDGQTIEPQDIPRLASQLERVRELMKDGKWRTLGEIQAAIGGGSGAGISARLRDHRKPKFGAWIMDSRRVAGTAGLWEYRILPPVGTQQESLWEQNT